MPTQVATGVHRLGDDFVNFFAIEEGTELTRVDAGLPAHYGQLTALLASIGRSVRDVRALLLTHAHLDHVGLAGRLVSEAGTAVWAHALDLPALANPLKPAPGAEPERSLGRYLLRRPSTLRLPLHIVRSGALRTPAVTSAQPFPDSPTLDIPGRPRMVEVPGHTPGSVAFHLPDRGVVLTGDALVTDDRLAGRAGPTILCAGFTHDTARALASLDALANLGADVVLPGHGDPFAGDIADAVAQAQQAGAA